MKNSFRLTRIFGIDIEVHITFFLLLIFFFMIMGFNGIALVLGVFFFVTIHELCHSLAARHFGISVKRITLLPIGGVAMMSENPSKPSQELIISLAGPLSNLLVVVIFYWPMQMFLGTEKLFYAFKAMMGVSGYTGHVDTIAYIYWLNLFLAGFNLLPAFPMDGGRVLRAILSYKLSYKKATEIAVRMGHIFALVFAYIGIVHGQLFLLLIAVFLYMSASNEGVQVDVQETIKGYTVQHVMPKDMISVTPETPVNKLLELAFQSRQDNFPVMLEGKYKGMVFRKSVVGGMYADPGAVTAGDIMSKDIPVVKLTDKLIVVQKLMVDNEIEAMAVEKDGEIVGMVTAADLNKVFFLINAGR